MSGGISVISYCPVLDPQLSIIHAEAGAGDVAAGLSQRIQDFREHYDRPRMDILIPEIQGLIESSVVGTAGAQVIPVDSETVNRAIAFARLLPKSLPLPEVAPDPDGEISFDWTGSSGRMFSVSINGMGRLAFAGRFGDKSKIHGTEDFSGQLPSEVLRGIRKTVL